jgi:hypothetical protein
VSQQSEQQQTANTTDPEEKVAVKFGELISFLSTFDLTLTRKGQAPFVENLVFRAMGSIEPARDKRSIEQQLLCPLNRNPTLRLLVLTLHLLEYAEE